MAPTAFSECVFLEHPVESIINGEKGSFAVKLDFWSKTRLEGFQWQNHGGGKHGPWRAN